MLLALLCSLLAPAHAEDDGSEILWTPHGVPFADGRERLLWDWVASPR